MASTRCSELVTSTRCAPGRRRRRAATAPPRVWRSRADAALADLAVTGSGSQGRPAGRSRPRGGRRPGTPAPACCCSWPAPIVRCGSSWILAVCTWSPRRTCRPPQQLVHQVQAWRCSPPRAGRRPGATPRGRTLLQLASLVNPGLAPGGGTVTGNSPGESNRRQCRLQPNI